MRSAAISLAIIACVCLIASMPGCSGRADGRVTVRGEVKLDGKPLLSGVITFLPLDGKGATAGGTIVDGKYETAIAPGDKKVEIRAERVTGKQRRVPDDPASETFEVKQQYLPARYNTATTLKATIPPAGGTADFTLDSQ